MRRSYAIRPLVLTGLLAACAAPEPEPETQAIFHAEHRPAFEHQSGADGSFSIDGLPAGDYEVEAWHEELGSKAMNVSVAADGTAEANFDFSPSA